MSTVHFLNVRSGDCTIIQHNSSRVSVIDVCAGNYSASISDILLRPQKKTQMKMCDVPTNPVTYLKDLGITSIFRFILTHPDMDHLDGFANLVDEFGIANFWDNGLRREDLDFEGSPYNEDDWKKYKEVIERKFSSTTVLTPLANSRNKYFNQGDNVKGGDGLYILAPDKGLVDAANQTEDPNDGSYVLLYRSPGGKILIPGDAHDATLEYVLNKFKADVSDISVLIAPHHGRNSDRDFEFLDTLRPRLTLFGCAPPEYLSHEEWEKRGLRVVSNAEAGNIVLDCDTFGIDVYLENEGLTETPDIKNSQGYSCLGRIAKLNS
jgi:competence protein ComEC